MSEKSANNLKLSRRTFLKATGALGAAATMSGASGKLLKKNGQVAYAQEAPEKTIIPTWCHGCSATATNCAVLAHVENGRLVQIEGNPEAGNNGLVGSSTLCAKAHTAAQYLYNPARLKYPMKRVGEKGEGKFERITWDEALDTIATKLKEGKEKYGPETFCLFVSEFFPVRDQMGRRFLNVYGSPNYSESALCHGPRYLAGNIVNGFTSEAPDDWKNSKLIVNWGSNPENSNVNTGAANAILNALEAGVKYIDIRPMMDAMASKADQWVPIRPGTDCALALAILHVLIKEKLYDAEFVNEWCYGFDKLSEHVAQFPPEWAAPITGLDAELITNLARTMGTTKPMCIKTGNGLGDQQRDGTTGFMAVSLIEAITGNLDVPGGNYGGYSMPTMIPTRSFFVETLLDRLPEDAYDKLLWPSYALALQKRKDLISPVGFHTPQSATYKVLKTVLTGEGAYVPRVLCALQTSVLSQLRNPKQNAEALKKAEFFFVIDQFWSPAVDYADIVLPACSLYEQSHNLATKNRPDGTWIGIRNKVAEPLGDTRSDWQIWLDLAVKMGYEDDFWGGDMDECLRAQLEPSGITLEELREAPRGIFVPRTEPLPERQYRRYAQLFANLPHGKVQCYNEVMGGQPDADGVDLMPYLPEYKGPPESLAGTPELAEEYPLVFSDVHAFRLDQHSSYTGLPYLRELYTYPWVKINPATAKKYGINDGDWMKVESPHGWIKMVAIYREGLPPDVLMSKRGWWQTCEELGEPGYQLFDGGSEVNVLYNGDDALFDKVSSQMAKQTLVKISKL